MIVYLLALEIGIVAGLRAMTAPAAVSWAAHAGMLHLEGSRLAFMGNAWTPWVFTALAVVELVTDQLPSTPSRTVPVQFGTRIASGALCGAAFGVGIGMPILGAAVGVAGAVVGTLGGRAARARLAAGFASDTRAAFLEDAVAIGASILALMAIS